MLCNLNLWKSIPSLSHCLTCSCCSLQRSSELPDPDTKRPKIKSPHSLIQPQSDDKIDQNCFHRAHGRRKQIHTPLHIECGRLGLAGNTSDFVRINTYCRPPSTIILFDSTAVHWKWRDVNLEVARNRNSCCRTQHTLFTMLSPVNTNNPDYFGRLVLFPLTGRGTLMLWGTETGNSQNNLTTFQSSWMRAQVIVNNNN